MQFFILKFYLNSNIINETNFFITILQHIFDHINILILINLFFIYITLIIFIFLSF